MTSWGIFFLIFIVLLVFDLGFLHKKGNTLSIKKSLLLSITYILISFVFCYGVYLSRGVISAQEFLTGYVIEKTLSIDNIFVISMIFSYYKIPGKYQHRILFWGILAAVLLRGILIGFGAVLVQEFSFILYIFSAFLIYTGIKMLNQKSIQPDLKDNFFLKIVDKFVHVTNLIKEEKFFIYDPEKKYVLNPQSKKIIKTSYVATPLFLSLVLVEFVDLIFAVDSVPAIFSITTDPYIIYTSNIFAILGLRSLYFALQAMIDRFTYLQTSLSVLLIFIGGKIFIADFLGIEKVPTSITLGVTISILSMGVLFSLLYKKPNI